MTMNRREFSKAVGATGLALAAGSSFLLSGCNAIQDIENWAPVGQAALDSILAILGANNIAISPAIAAAKSVIDTACADLVTACKGYLAISPAPMGALAKVEAALSAVTSAFSGFFTQLALPGGSLFNLIAGLIQIVLTTIAGFTNQLPTGTQIVGTTARFGATVVPIIPKQRTRRAFKRDFNSTLDAASHAGVTVPKSAYQSLSFFEHF